MLVVCTHARVGSDFSSRGPHSHRVKAQHVGGPCPRDRGSRLLRLLVSGPAMHASAALPLCPSLRKPRLDYPSGHHKTCHERVFVFSLTSQKRGERATEHPYLFSTTLCAMLVPFASALHPTLPWVLAWQGAEASGGSSQADA